MKTIRLLSKTLTGTTVLIAAPGPSLEAIHALRRADYTYVLGVNLAVERVACDSWFVVDSPQRIRDPKKQARFLAVDKALPLVVPTTSDGGWPGFDPYFFTATDPFHHNIQQLDITMSRDPQAPPGIPCFAGAPFGAAGLALYMGAKKVILAGVDYHGTVHATASQLQRMGVAWGMLQRWAAANKREIEQANPASLLKLA